MTSSYVEVNDNGLSERMKQFPAEYAAVQKVTMEASLIAIHEAIPPYPTVPNPTRTGLLGKSLGSSMEGGKVGKPSIYEIKSLGQSIEGRFGTDLEYAPFVIGENPIWWHYRWWKLSQVAKATEKRIVGLWNTAAEKMAKFLNGKGM